jgi:hypothetical protein
VILSDLSPEEQDESNALGKALLVTSRKAVAAGGSISSNPLSSPLLISIAKDALSSSLGPRRLGDEPFPLTVWQHGATHVGKNSPGVRFTGSINTFLSVLAEQSKLIMPKRSGWVVEPSTNPTGVRTNAATLSLHSIFLDCDDHGTWNQTLTALREIGLAFIAYQSSGYSPDHPKWRLVLPLAAPFSVLNDLERAAWKKMYHRVRVLVGALGGLSEEGFDPRTDAPSIPWFLGTRRTESDLPRDFLFHPGASLDLTSLALALPPVIEEDIKPKRLHTTVKTERDPMSDAELDLVIAALAATCNAIPRGRRDLYLSLPGVLLDRGVTPEDCLTICTEVSLAYPRKHAEKHQDNCHSAKTTIGKWQAGDDTYTRIGTLQATFPDVAAVLDRLVPDLVQQGLREAMDSSLASPSVSVDISPRGSDTPAAPTVEAPTIQRKPGKAAKLRKKLEKLAEEKVALEDAKRSTAGIVLGSVLRTGGFHGYVDIRIREKAIEELFNLVGFEVEKVSFDEIVEVIGKISADDYRIGATTFAKARARRERWDAAAPERLLKRQAEVFALRQKTAAEYEALRNQ